MILIKNLQAQFKVLNSAHNSQTITLKLFSIMIASFAVSIEYLDILGNQFLINQLFLESIVPLGYFAIQGFCISIIYLSTN